MSRNDKSNAAGGGISFAGLLTIAFIILKLCNVIDWSWWWVLSPIWISLGLAVVIFIVAMVVIIIADVHDSRKSLKRLRRKTKDNRDR